MLDSETSAVVKHGRAPTEAAMRLDQSDCTIPTDEDLLRAIPIVSRKLFRHEGGGVCAYDLALHLAPTPGCYDVPCDEVLAHVTARMRALARVGRLKKGSYRGRPFYRLGV